jgi:hypothetical protein
MDEPMIYGKLAIDAHDAKIRAEAADRAVKWMARNSRGNEILLPDLRAAILAGEVEE